MNSLPSLSGFVYLAVYLALFKPRVGLVRRDEITGGQVTGGQGAHPAGGQMDPGAGAGLGSVFIDGSVMHLGCVDGFGRVAGWTGASGPCQSNR